MDFDNGESVYNLIPRVKVVSKGKLFRSKHNPSQPPSYSTFGATDRRTIANASGHESAVARVRPSSVGPKTSRADPKQYTKRYSGFIRVLPTDKTAVAAFKRPSEETAKKASVPRRDERPSMMGLKTEKNFVALNTCLSSLPKQRIVAPPLLPRTSKFSWM